MEKKKQKTQVEKNKKNEKKENSTEKGTKKENSTEKGTKKEKQDIPNEELGKEEVEQLKEEIEKLEVQLTVLEESLSNKEDELKKLREESLRAIAEADNFKKRTQRDYDLSMKYRAQGFAKDILPVLDNLERALGEETKDQALKDGIEIVYKQLISALEQEGIVQINSLHQEFDPEIHHAVMTEACEDFESNIIIEEFQKGYMIKDRILRPSMVKVSQ